jgi:hypothetical protein
MLILGLTLTRCVDSIHDGPNELHCHMSLTERSDATPPLRHKNMDEVESQIPADPTQMLERKDARKATARHDLFSDRSQFKQLARFTRPDSDTIGICMPVVESR